MQIESIWQNWEREKEFLEESVPVGVPLTQELWDVFCSYAYSFGAGYLELARYKANRWNLDNRAGVTTKLRSELL